MNLATMTFRAYQQRALQTAVYPDCGRNFTYPALGLCGEAGEVAEKIKKIIRDKGGCFGDEERAQIALELGDVLWYAAILASEFGLSLQDIANANLDKLAKRAKRGKIRGSGDNR